MTERDVLICGCCSSQFSDLKVFIDHKQNCGSSVSSVSGNNDVCSFVSTAQHATHFGSQQIVLPSQSHASIVSLPVGMPHVFLQTSSGLSQMYRIVLEPSTINSGLQLSQPCQVQNLFQQPNISSTETQFGITTEGKSSPREHQDTPLSKKQEMSAKEVPVVSSPLTLNDSSITRLALMSPVDTSWTTHRTEAPTATFDTLDSNNISDKTSNLHTEEEVATFLATQLVSQSTSSNTNSKTRENINITKYNIVLEDPSSNQSNLNFLESNQKINKSVQARDNDIIKNEKSYNKQSTGTEKSVMEASIQCLEGREIIDKGTKKIACTFENCKFSTLHKKDMVRHVRKHTGEKPFECSECGLRLSRQDKLKVHLRIHSKERPYACTEPGCSYRGNEREHLRKHIRTHTNERPFRCQFCPYGARDGSHLTVHLRSHTGDAPFHCQVDGCAATFKTSSDLKRHEKLHTGEKPFRCSECDYACTLKANLKVHFRINHCKDEKLNCKSCPFTATSRKQLKEHEINHPYFSPFSEREYESKTSKREDSTSDINPFSPAKQVLQQTDTSGKKVGLSKGRRSARPFCPKNFKCNECGSGFVREDSYRSHIRQHERKKKEEERKALSSAKELEELSQKEKAKPVYTLNYILQDTNNASNLSPVELDLTKNRNPAIRQTKFEAMLPTSNAINSASIRNTQTLPNGSASTSEMFSTYMITIDGIPSVYSTAKDPQLTDSQSLSQDDPVVHILSSPISHSLPTTNAINPSSKIIPIDEEIIEQSIT